MAEDRSHLLWQRFDILAKATIPVILFYATFQINDQAQQRAQLQLQADRAERLLTRLLSDKEDERLASLAIVSFLAKQGQFPDELMPVLTHLAGKDKQENVAEAAAVALKKVADEAKDEKVANLARQNLQTLPSRVYIHVRSESQLPAAEHLKELLEANMLAVPSIVRVASGPSRPELRYYRKEERAEAEKIVDLLHREGIGAALNDLSERGEFKGVAIRARTFEYWFAQ